MFRLIAQRLVALVATLFAASLVVFLVMQVLPGDPATIILGVGARDDTLAALRQQLGLDRPLIVQYLAWVGGLLSGDLGTSYTYSRPVSELVLQRLNVSLPLALMAIALSTAIAIPCGVLAAARRNRAADIGVSALAQIGIAIPNFWFAMLLILLFSIHLGWFPAGGFAGWDGGLIPGLRSLLLPAVALALPQAAILTRVTRSSVLEVLGEDHVRTARAKGLTRSAALWRHAVRNALIPVVTIMGLQFSFLVAGTIVIENVFYLPGLGRLLFQAIAQRDLIVVQSLVVLLAGFVVVVNFLVDLAYLSIDPRLRSGRHG
ncbi:peptide/nickel transport system permease protein [Tepidamorphus gemmatus]|jgi:peptide/nickel transport system permease protein|uniref:Peptide/nickel transport system permease protein n=1 Tax=Tepidamorphus gemmatus TaxID=747076 RepID=A0A4R3LZV4_9HYPH|nr:ABC transporter permease [Tepidamorphus gemmatus]TCT05439.1 peptide/nickel transport system permease protein [Tepidamorphus gemmatus]